MATVIRPTRFATNMALALAAWPLMSGLALAQSTAPASAGTTTAPVGTTPAPAAAASAPTKAADKGEIQTINVTANRRAENQQKVNVSVTAVSGETLAERNITDLSQMEAVTPGFTFGRSGVDARPAIRGVRTENVAVNADTTIGYFVDGIYKSRAAQAMLGFVDVGRVEVLRGPQGTLFGRNTFGGSVAITTNEPVLKAFEAGLSLQLGSFGKFRTEGVFNVPLGDTVAVRIAGLLDRADPWVKNDFNPAAGLFDERVKYVRGSVKFKPTREFDATFRMDVASQGGNGGSAFGYKLAGTYLDNGSCQQLFNTNFTALNTRGGNRDAVNDCTRTVGAGNGTGANAIGTSLDLGIPLYRPGDLRRIDNDYQPYLSLRDNNVSGELAYRFPSFTIKSITGYADFEATRTQDTDFSSSTIGIDYQKTGAQTLSQELQILSEGSGPLNYVAGVYYFKDELTGLFINQQLPRTIRSSAAAGDISLPQNGAGFYDLQAPVTTSKALYGQLSFRITEAFTVTGGVRYTRDVKQFKFANANSVLPLTGAGAPDGTRISLTTPQPADSAFTPGAANVCTGANNQPGFRCLPGTNTVVGATYSDVLFTKTTGKVALDYNLSKDQLLYASASTGFRSGGFNSGQALEVIRTFKPETVTAFEIGSKNRFMNNTLQLNLAAFSNQYTNLQEQRQVPIGATTVSVIFNAAKAKARGLEAELEWRTTKALTFAGSLSLLDAKYTSFPDVALPFGTSVLVADPTSTTPQTDANGIVIAPAGQRRVFAPGYNCGVVPGTGGAGQPAAAYGCDLTGKRLPYAPRLQSAVSAKYEFALPGGGAITPLLVLTYNSGFFGQPTNADAEKQGAFLKGDFKLNWRINDTFAVQAFVDNFTDKQTYNRFVWGGGGGLQVSSAAPRKFGLKLMLSYF
jgi:iron complex outermembrane recepter protein